MLGRKIEGEGSGYFYFDEVFVSDDAMMTTSGTHVHLAFQAPDRATVDRFHSAALAVGAKDHGKPGLREQYYAGYRPWSSIQTATTSKRSTTGPHGARWNQLY